MKAPWTYFFSRRPRPQRGLAEPGDRSGGDQGADQRHHLSRQGCRLRQARMDEPIGHHSAGDVGDQLPAPLHGNMPEDHQVNRQGTQPRSDGQRGVRHPRRARRDMLPAAGARRLAQVVLDPPRRRSRDLLLLIRPGNLLVGGIRQITAAGTGTPGIMVLGPVRDLPRHGCPLPARLLPALFLRPLSSAPLLPRGLPARQVIRARRHEEFPLFRDPAQSAASSCSRRPATIASSPAIFSACVAITCACSRISASRGSADRSPGSASVTARDHPGNHAQPPRQHHARR